MSAYASIPTAEPVPTEATLLEAKVVAGEDTRKVTVSSPLDLPEGYTFYADYEESMICATVPKGGVKKGHLIVIPFNQAIVSKGVACQWKDDLFDCFQHGICHPSLINACCCPLLLIGQVMTRLKLNWCGNPVSSKAWMNTFTIMIFITVAYIILNAIGRNDVIEEDGNIRLENDEGQDSGYLDIVSSIFGAFVLFVTYNVRKHIRAKYQIPEQNCIGCEDFCCALWCGACVTSQMARHTTDYDRVEAKFCGSTGQSEP